MAKKFDFSVLDTDAFGADLEARKQAIKNLFNDFVEEIRHNSLRDIYRENFTSPGDEETKIGSLIVNMLTPGLRNELASNMFEKYMTEKHFLLQYSLLGIARSSIQQEDMLARMAAHENVRGAAFA